MVPVILRRQYVRIQGSPPQIQGVPFKRVLRRTEIRLIGEPPIPAYGPSTCHGFLHSKEFRIVTEEARVSLPQTPADPWRPYSGSIHDPKRLAYRIRRSDIQDHLFAQYVLGISS